MPHVLITGANRGLGLEFVRQYRQAGWDVVATARQSSPELDALDVRVETLDMQDLEAVEKFGDRLDRLDLLIANAGTYGPREATSAAEARDWGETFVTNTIAPFLLALTAAFDFARQPFARLSQMIIVARKTEI